MASAGNGGDGLDTVTYPAKYPEVISVGAVDNTLQVANYSSRGSRIDVVAPGTDIISTTNYDSYTPLSGTSMAAPHVTGEIADMLSSQSKMSPAKIKDTILKTATPLGTQTSYGSGLVNVVKAIAYANQ